MRIRENMKRYGLSNDDIKKLKLPKPASRVTFLTIEQIFHPKSNFSIVEQVVELEKLRDGISKKLHKINSKAMKIQKLKAKAIKIEENKINKCIVIRRALEDSDDDEE